MKTLNLVYPDKSDIKYTIQKFPDGQQNVVIQSSVDRNIPICNVKEYPILINSRLNDFKDLELIICATKSLRNLGVKEIHFYSPYLLGARSDRKFEDGGNNYLKDVISPIIDNLNFESVTVMDPHSYVTEACINNFKKLDNKRLVEFALHNISPKNTPGLSTYKGAYNLDSIVLVSPDAGASHKIYKLAEQIGYTSKIITCSKERDNLGKLTKTVVPVKDTGPLAMKDYVIIDDICDGGATFINIAKELKKTHNCNHIYLIVTHGIFSKGLTELAQYFDGIYTTNSYKNCNQLELLKVKQLNVF